MNFWGKRSAIVITFLVGLSLTRAALIEGTDTRFGAGSLTIDPVHQLAWLDLTHSVGYSFNAALQAAGSGGVFEGYRHATVTEVAGLFQTAGLAGPNFYPPNNPNIAALINLLGATSIQDGQAELFASSGSSASAGSRTVTRLDFVAGSEPHYQFALEGLSYGLDSSAPTIGNWLVMAVPEPSSATLLLLALGALGIRKLRTHR